MKILIATEDITDRLLLQLMLRRLGHEPRPVSDGGELLEMSERERPEVILLDMQAPVLDGGEAIRKMIGQDSRPAIVGLTTAIRAQERRTPLERCMDDFLQKPVDEFSLRQALERCTSTSPGTMSQNGPAVDPTSIWIAAMVRRLESLDLLRDPRESAKLIADFLLAADHHVVALSDAMIAYDQPALISAAHDMAVLSDLMGFGDLAAQCRELETTAQAGAGPMSSDLREAIASAYCRLRPGLLRYRTSLIAAADDASKVEPQPRDRKEGA